MSSIIRFFNDLLSHWQLRTDIVVSGRSIPNTESSPIPYLVESQGDFLILTIICDQTYFWYWRYLFLTNLWSLRHPINQLTPNGHHRVVFKCKNRLQTVSNGCLVQTARGVFEFARAGLERIRGGFVAAQKSDLTSFLANPVIAEALWCVDSRIPTLAARSITRTIAKKIQNIIGFRDQKSRRALPDTKKQRFVYAVKHCWESILRWIQSGIEFLHMYSPRGTPEGTLCREIRLQIDDVFEPARGGLNPPRTRPGRIQSAHGRVQKHAPKS